MEERGPIQTQLEDTTQTTEPKDETGSWVDSTTYIDLHHYNIYENDVTVSIFLITELT